MPYSKLYKLPSNEYTTVENIMELYKEKNGTPIKKATVYNRLHNKDFQSIEDLISKKLRKMTSRIDNQRVKNYDTSNSVDEMHRLILKTI